MNTRITVGMLSKQYNKSLNQSLSALNYYSDRAVSQRKYNKASEDPVSALRAYKARRNLNENESYQTNLRDVQGLMTTAESAVMDVNAIVQQINSSDLIKAISDTVSADGRTVIATKISKLQESLLTVMNTQYSDRYIFGGTQTEKAPFSLDSDGNLLYRNIRVDTGEHIGFDGTAAVLNLCGTKVDFGQANGDAYDDYMIDVVDGTAPYSLDTSAKTLKISLDISGGATYQDLQDALQSAFTAAGIPGADPALITVGNAASPVTAAGKGVVSGGEDPIAAGTAADLDALSRNRF
jgi:flagellin-like hook-associated protein FlgL